MVPYQLFYVASDVVDVIIKGTKITPTVCIILDTPVREAATTP